jgi:hypothetical protein
VHWSTKYIGKPYELGEADCAALVAEVRENEFKSLVPDFVRTYRENT